MATMNDRASAEKEQRFEEGMSDEMEHANRDAADARPTIM
jgi:hypothetical protein